MEPHWLVTATQHCLLFSSKHAELSGHVSRNPTLEDQALARIYRLGQRNEVTTVRFYVRDSFEQVSHTHTDARRLSNELPILSG